MAKKDNKKKNNAKNVPHRDNYARISYLYQLSNHLTSTHPILARGITRNMDLVGKKTVSKSSPNLKRTICKQCHSILIPGLNMTMYIENLSKEKRAINDVLVWKCDCGKCKRFPVGKGENIVFPDRDGVRID
ncbi:Ribonuclease P protein subunit rpr2 [Spathaspora sp. JA1]|nr:Ribonuclease P protein subunit rpr2 [Spathaspora sp. JA1]